MPANHDERIIVTANARTTGVVMTIGDTEIAVKMPSSPGVRELNEDQARDAALRQFKRALEVALQELG